MHSDKNNLTAPLIMVEGNIGAGKSTFLKILEKNLDLDVIFEPTGKWQSKKEDDNLLHLFYKDTPRWAYTFQSYAFISRVQAILDYQAKSFSQKVQILERSVYCDRYCFAKNCFESGNMTKLEWQIYKEWFSWLVEKYAPQPAGFIYLYTTPETCHQRITKRSRSEEDEIPLSYLQSLHKRHEDWLTYQREITPHLAAVPVLKVDCNEEFETDPVVQKKLLVAIQEFIDQKILPVAPIQEQPRQTTL